MVVTRFAPSPTGDLHIGSARTALYCWLYSKKNKGKFILRIEDTDRERSTQESINVILEGMTWLGLDWDEGPIYQTERFDRYAEVIQQLMDNGHAYRCYCSKERLETLREKQMANKQKPRYDGHCRHQAPEDTSGSYVIRFKNPESGSVIINDLVRGKIEIKNKELDDLIIARSDGTPTYNLTVVVDDIDMGITHVLRGDDHINNTPRQMNIMAALDQNPPQYGHMPMILGDDGKRLSKRHGAASVMAYREMGILPQALINYILRLGWAHGDQEIFSVKEMIECFDISNINVAPSAFNTEKLLWLNQHYMRTLDPIEVAKELKWHFSQHGITTDGGPTLEALLDVQAARCKTLKEIVEKSRYFYEPVKEYDPSALKHFEQEESIEVLSKMRMELNNLKDWTKEAIQTIVHQTADDLEIKMGKVAQPIRVALTGSTMSPSIDDTIQLMGEAETLQRLDQAINFIGDEA